jgi:3D (Asp-Asp-Asp) domain-containing protein
MMCWSKLICLLAVLIPLLDCAQSEDMKSMQVTATAYTMDESETKKGKVGVAAWGDQLEPGMKVIAVSRDLITKGLDHNTEVRIEGLEGTYVVRDKMNKRWKNKIDIFMGNDREKALKWGKRKVRIYWRSSSQDKE